MGFLGNLSRSFGGALRSPGLLQGIAGGLASASQGDPFATGMLTQMKDFTDLQYDQRRLGMLQSALNLRKEKSQRLNDLLQQQQDESLYAQGALPAYARQHGINLPANMPPALAQNLFGQMLENQVSQGFQQPAPDWERYKTVGGALVDPATGQVVYQGQQGPSAWQQRAMDAGYEPGTPEAEQFVRQGILRPPMSTNITNIPAPPSGYAYTNLNEPAAGLTPIPGGPSDPTALQKPTEGQRKTGGLLTGARESEKLYEQSGAGALATTAGESAWTRWATSAEGKRSADAKGAWINNILREETGAEAPVHEQQMYDRIYFPQPGDDDATIAQKKVLRERKMAEMEQKAGSIASQPETGSEMPWEMNW